jgi:catechol 2,3-dioxygenase
MYTASIRSEAIDEESNQLTDEPCFDVAHLGHLELLTNRPEESLDFFVNVYGLTESSATAGPIVSEAPTATFSSSTTTPANTSRPRASGRR